MRLTVCKTTQCHSYMATTSKCELENLIPVVVNNSHAMCAMQLGSNLNALCCMTIASYTCMHAGLLLTDGLYTSQISLYNGTIHLNEY